MLRRILVAALTAAAAAGTVTAVASAASAADAPQDSNHAAVFKPMGRTWT